MVKVFICSKYVEKTSVICNALFLVAFGFSASSVYCLLLMCITVAVVSVLTVQHSSVFKHFGF